MLAARKLAQTQISSASSRSLSVLSAAYEFPHTHVNAKAATPAKLNNTTLNSGVQIIAREKDSGVVSFKVVVAGGSSTETAAQRGAAQLLASAAYAGNARNSGLRTVRYLEQLGARFSATSDREKIVYDVSVMADRVEPAIATILALVSSPPAEAYLLEEAKEAAALSYKLRSACPFAQVKDAVHEAAYGAGAGYGSNGYAENLKKLNVDEVLAYRQAHFTRENLTIVTNGGASADAVKSILEAHLAHFPTKGSNKGVVLPAATFVGGDVKVRADLDGKTHLALAFPTPAGDVGRAYEVLAGVVNARVAGQGICAGAFTHGYHHGGLFGVRASGCATKATEQLQKAVGELKAIAGGSATETEAIKTQISLRNALALEEGGSSATSLLLTKSSGDVRGVAASAVADAAKQVLKTATPAFAVYGNVAGVPAAKSFF
jgi:predicted Zn-dependent peptidase